MKGEIGAKGTVPSGWPASQGKVERQTLRTAKGILLDWDGCVAVNNRILSGARQLIIQHAERITIVSNNSTHLPGDLAAILARQGVFVPPERIFLAGVETIRHVLQLGARRVMLFSAPNIRRLARDMGICVVREDPDLVILMRDARFTYAKLEGAANALRNGAGLIVANADLTHPGPFDRVVPETGALLAALQACAGETGQNPCVIGKPGPLLFERACQSLAIRPEEAVMIGDNPDTDGEGALRLGIKSILVGGASPLRIEHLLDPTFA